MFTLKYTTRKPLGQSRMENLKTHVTDTEQIQTKQDPLCYSYKSKSGRNLVEDVYSVIYMCGCISLYYGFSLLF